MKKPISLAYKTHEEFAKIRRENLSIGGSEVGAVAGLSKWSTPVEIFKLKTDPTYEKTFANPAALEWGRKLEDVVARHFGEVHGVKVQKVNFMLFDKEHDYFSANIDRAIINPEVAKTVRWKDGRLSTDTILEIKTASTYAKGEWSEEGEPLKVPAQYFCQCQWYMSITGATKCWLAVLIGGSDYRDYLIEADENVQTALRNAARKFWTEHVLTGIPPEPVSGEDVKLLAPVDDGSTIQADTMTCVAIDELRTIKAKIKELEETEEALTSSIQVAMAGHSQLALGDQVIATWKAPSKPTVTFDHKAFRKANPNIDYTPWLSEKLGSRRFVLK